MNNFEMGAILLLLVVFLMLVFGLIEIFGQLAEINRRLNKPASPSPQQGTTEKK